MAASFHAPIAGVLMTQNEGSSFWTNRITIRSFLCAMVSMFTLTVYLNDWSPYIYSKSLITFGSRSSTDQPFGYHIVEIVFFGLLGVVGGVLGGLFARCNAFVWRVRAHLLTHTAAKIGDAMFMACMTAAIFVFLPLGFDCINARQSPFSIATVCSHSSAQTLLLGDAWNASSPTTGASLDGSVLSRNDTVSLLAGADGRLECLQWNCEAGEYNQLASLLMARPENSISMLFQRDFDIETKLLWVVLIVQLFLSIVVYGAYVPVGLLVPCYLIGAAYGRIFSDILNAGDVLNGVDFDPGVYALIGAAAFLQVRACTCLLS